MVPHGFRILQVFLLIIATPASLLTGQASLRRGSTDKKAVASATRKLSKPSESNQSNPGNISPSTSDFLKVTILPSRKEVVPNGSYGVYADIENVSSAPVLILPNETVLVVLPEVQEPSACVAWERAIFPTQEKMSSEEENDPWSHPLIIPPGEHYTVFWDLEGPIKSDQKPPPRVIRMNTKCGVPFSRLFYLGFVPGDYAFSVVGEAYVLPRSISKPTDLNLFNSSTSQLASARASETTSSDLIREAKSGAIPTHFFTETKLLKVGLSQLTTLLAAFCGSCAAYWIIALRKDQDWDALMEVLSTSAPWPRKIIAVASLLRNALLGSIMGAVVTIVASRLSDTNFPVKVSVNDWWGATTIGFVAFFIGNKFIDRLKDLGGSATPSTLGKHPVPKSGLISGTGASVRATPDSITNKDADAESVSRPTVEY